MVLSVPYLVSTELSCKSSEDDGLCSKGLNVANAWVIACRDKLEHNKSNSEQVKDGLEYGTKENKKEAHTGNPNRNVGGTAYVSYYHMSIDNMTNHHHSKDGGLSTADTVADGGPDDAEDDGEYKPGK